MNIIIVGCGKVGSALAEQLESEGHDITVIDTNPEAIARVTDVSDVMGIAGNGVVYYVQKEAGIEYADMFIAMTGSDELNLLCCLIAKKAGTLPLRKNLFYFKKLLTLPLEDKIRSHT